MDNGTFVFIGPLLAVIVAFAGGRGPSFAVFAKGVLALILRVGNVEMNVKTPRNGSALRAHAQHQPLEFL
jgi:hypothetical protein